MKKRNLIFIISLLVIIFFYFMVNGTFLKSIENYSLLSSSNKEVPAYLYRRNNNEMVLIFDEKLRLGIYAVLIIVPDHKMVGLPEGGKSSYVRFLRSYIYQKSDANQITAIYPRNTYFDDSKIFDVQFISNNEIKFRTSLTELKEYGDTFILRLFN